MTCMVPEGFCHEIWTDMASDKSEMATFCPLLPHTVVISTDLRQELNARLAFLCTS